jgi:hypothetical protein
MNEYTSEFNASYSSNYTQKKAKPKRIGSLSSLAQVLPGVCDGLQLDKKINEMALLALFPGQVEGLCGQVAAQGTRAIRLKKQGYKMLLVVKVSNAALASELTFQVPALKEALNRFQPQTGITVDQIQLVVGSL